MYTMFFLCCVSLLVLYFTSWGVTGVTHAAYMQTVASPLKIVNMKEYIYVVVPSALQNVHYIADSLKETAPLLHPCAPPCLSPPPSFPFTFFTFFTSPIFLPISLLPLSTQCFGSSIISSSLTLLSFHL